MAKNIWIVNLEENFPLTAFDQVAPRIYTRLIYGFAFPDPKNIESAVAYLKGGLQRAFLQWPFLAGQVIEQANSQEVKLLYSRKPEKFNLNVFPNEVFGWRSLDKPVFPWMYEELQKAGNPPSAMDKDILTLSPLHPVKGNTYHPVTLRASFIEGGLLLGLSSHHSVMDGSSLAEFLKCFAGNGSYADLANANNAELDVLINHRLNLLDAPFPSTDIISLPEYDFSLGTTVNTPIAGSHPGGSFIAKVLTFAATTISSLYRRSLVHLRKTHAESVFVSPTDVLCGLIWVHVIRARFNGSDDPRTTTTTTTTLCNFATAVDVRSLLSLPQTYMGNMFLRLMPSLPMATILGDAATSSNNSSSINAVALAAYSIRQNIIRLTSSQRGDDDDDYLSQHLTAVYAYREIGVDELSRASAAALRNWDTGLDNSVWSHMGADVDFGILGVPVTVAERSAEHGQKPEWVRKTYSANGGSMNVLPRCKASEADWEILLALSVAEMVVVEKGLEEYLSGLGL